MSETIECEITGMTAGGEGVARHDGKVVFVAGALVGERVRAQIVSKGSRSDRARTVEILMAVGRQATPCRHDHAGGCGGCSLLHATRAAQARAKRTVVADALERIARQDPALVAQTLTPGPDLGYRNHARFGVDRNGGLTYVARQDAEGRAPVSIESCAVLDPRLDALRAELAGRVLGVEAVELRIGARTGEKLVVLHGAPKLPPGIDPTKIDAAIVMQHEDRLVPVRGFPAIHDLVLEHRFRISSRSFFQVNTDGAECIATLVRDLAASGPAATALDLYAGVGLFTVAALPGASVLGVEIDAASAADFRHNVGRRAGVKLRTERVAEVLRDLRPGRDTFDLAVINPPRAGMGEDAVRAVDALRIPRLIVVSCDPGSLARDVASLARSRFDLVAATPVDQFPGTPHVETVAELVRRGA